MSISKLHAAAISMIEAGYPVFPCVEDGKAPACPGGFHDATLDRGRIDEWWTENPHFNLAFSPNAVGLGVVDLDGTRASEAWNKLVTEYSIPATYEVETPRGGRHLYFAGELPQTAWAPGGRRNLGEHIDTRGVGSYVLAPPSIVNGKPYRVINDIEPAPVPEWIVDRLRKRDEQRASSVEALDDPGNVLRARTYLSGLVDGGSVAVSGRGGNNTTYRVACEVLGLGTSTDTCRTLLEEIYNPACIPPWSADELGAIIANAATYAQNEAGAWGAAPATEVFAGNALDKLLAESASEPAPTPKRSRFYFEDVSEQDEGRDIPFLIAGLIPDMTTVLIVGAKGTFKSFIAQHILMSLAARVKMFEEPSRYGATFFGAHEGRNDMRRRRRQAWEILHERRGERYPYFIAPAPRVASPEECEEFREQIRVRLRTSSTRIVAIALDTVAKCLAGLDENSAQDMGVFVAFCDSLVEEFQCPVIALHHTGKAARGSRGSGSLEAGFGTVIDADRSGKKLVSLSVRYHKDAEEPEQPFHLEAQLVGGSLVFTPVSEAEFKAQTIEDDPFSRTKIGAVLRSLGAVGYDNRTTMQILAGEITPKVESETQEAHDRAVAKSKGILGKLAGGSLKGYCGKIGREWVWWLPDAEPSVARE